jgi:hypothetical protein
VISADGKSGHIPGSYDFVSQKQKFQWKQCCRSPALVRGLMPYLSYVASYTTFITSLSISPEQINSKKRRTKKHRPICTDAQYINRDGKSRRAATMAHNNHNYGTQYMKPQQQQIMPFDVSFCHSSASSVTNNSMFSSGRSLSYQLNSERSLFKENIVHKEKDGTINKKAAWELREQAKLDSMPTLPKRSWNPQDASVDATTSASDVAVTPSIRHYEHDDEHDIGGNEQQEPLPSDGVIFHHSKRSARIQKALESKPADCLPFAFVEVSREFPKMPCRSRDTDTTDDTTETQHDRKGDPPQNLTRESRWASQSGRWAAAESNDCGIISEQVSPSLASYEQLSPRMKKKKADSSIRKKKKDTLIVLCRGDDSTSKISSSSNKKSKSKSCSIITSSETELSFSPSKNKKSESNPESVSSSPPTPIKKKTKALRKRASISPSSRSSSALTSVNRKYSPTARRPKKQLLSPTSDYVPQKQVRKQQSERRRRRKFIDDVLTSILEQDGDVDE